MWEDDVGSLKIWRYLASRSRLHNRSCSFLLQWRCAWTIVAQMQFKCSRQLVSIDAHHFSKNILLRWFKIKYLIDAVSIMTLPISLQSVEVSYKIIVSKGWSDNHNPKRNWFVPNKKRKYFPKAGKQFDFFWFLIAKKLFYSCILMPIVFSLSLEIFWVRSEDRKTIAKIMQFQIARWFSDVITVKIGIFAVKITEVFLLMKCLSSATGASQEKIRYVSSRFSSRCSFRSNSSASYAAEMGFSFMFKVCWQKINVCFCLTYISYNPKSKFWSALEISHRQKLMEAHVWYKLWNCN